ncbi:MAG: hypothetical protein RL139_1292 [Gemmatimonadota bacterium]|jgi:hypothetical protein
MANETTLTTAGAIITKRYDKDVPKAVQEEFPAFNSISKFEQEFGESFYLAVMGENPQGVSSTIENALTGMYNASYSRFEPSVVEVSGLVRIRNNVLRRAKTPGALVDVLKNDCDGMLRQLMQDQTCDMFGDGSGVLGRISSGQGSTTITLTVASDAIKFSVGMLLKGVDARTTSATVRSGSARVTAVDPIAGTVSTTGSNWNSQITSLAANDYLVRAGREVGAVTASTFACPTGFKAWLEGGTAPASLWGLTRTTNPAKYAGTKLDCANKPLEEALIEAATYARVYGSVPPDTLYVHPLDWADLAKTVSSKVQITKTSFTGSKGGIGFKAIAYDSPHGEITVIDTPFIDRNEAVLCKRKLATWHSAGPSPRLLKDGDGQDIVRVVGTSYLEVQFGSDCQFSYRQPYSGVRMTNFGA